LTELLVCKQMGTGEIFINYTICTFVTTTISGASLLGLHARKSVIVQIARVEWRYTL